MKRCTLTACFAAFALASPVLAQINTTCSRIGQFTNCQTNGVGGAPGVNWQAYSQQMIEQQNRSQAQTMAIIQQARERKQADALRALVNMRQQSAEQNAQGENRKARRARQAQLNRTKKR